ncbi:Fic family protein [Stappia sp.]|uniref:Fic family protein n=1 Tax=Stappia sp. TaxID=1870903 RepID=UPI003D0BDB4A
MDLSTFSDQAPGHFVATFDGAKAYVPAPLPPELDLSDITAPLTNAAAALGELKGACRRLQNPDVVVRPLQRREAVTSSAMEGTFTSDDELLLAEAGQEAHGNDSTREVYNYIRALNASLDLMRELPLSQRVLKTAHATLLSGLSPHRGSKKRPGEYKADQNWIGNGGLLISQARFVPPPPQETQVCMNALEAYINRPTVDLPILDLALTHYQIETIHPFSDGNGRVGRMLICLQSVYYNILEMPVLYMSSALEGEKDDYIRLMYNVSANAEWNPWIAFFMDKLSQSCRSTIETIDGIIALQEDYRTRAAASMRSSNIVTLVDKIFGNYVTTVPETATALGVSYPAARNMIDKLVEIGLLRELPGQYPKVFYAPEILRISSSNA